MRMHRVFTTSFALILLAVFGRATAESGSNASSTNQTGGVTAGSIGVLNLGAQNDPLRERLSASMASFNKSLFENVEAAIQMSDFTIYVSQSDPEFGSSDEQRKIYSFVAGPNYELGVMQIPKCAVTDGASLIGFVAGLTKTSSNAAVNLSPLQLQNPIFQKICRALSMPAQSVFPQAGLGGNANRVTTLFDLLNSGDDGVRITLIPIRNYGVTFDAEIIRDYWATALAVQYAGHFSPDNFDPQTRLQIESAMVTGKDLKITTSLSPFLLSGDNHDHPYPPQLLKEYGGRIESMDAEWQNFLMHATIRLNGQTYPVMRGRSYNTFLPLFTADDIGTFQFWRHLSDTNRLYEQLNCIAAKFAVEKSYAKSIDLPAFGQCATWEVHTSN